jgi:hypothetical protein
MARRMPSTDLVGADVLVKFVEGHEKPWVPGKVVGVTTQDRCVCPGGCRSSLLVCPASLLCQCTLPPPASATLSSTSPLPLPLPPPMPLYSVDLHSPSSLS